MNCPYCNKVINAMTGLQELDKFQKHLKKCKKYVKVDGGYFAPHENMEQALEVRHESGQ